MRALTMFGSMLVPAVALTGCPTSSGGLCEIDSDCSGEVCARNNECLAAANVRQARIEWTVRGMPASDAGCTTSPSLTVSFHGDSIDDFFGFEPVPCSAGVFSIDKIPTRFQQVEVSTASGRSKFSAIDSAGHARLDLTP